MSGSGHFLRPLAISTPKQSSRVRAVDLDESHMSVRSARKRLRRPQRREDTGTEVVVAIPKNLPDPPAFNASNSANTNANNNNATRRVPPKQKRPAKLARLIAAEIRRACFARVVRSIGQEKESRALSLRWQASALDCLQEATEAFLVDFFSFAARAAAHAKRVTVMVRDFNFIMQFYNKNLSL
ncbi:hypothetical protein ACTXT7_009615 [Hymenolepis weldensis]